jgi:hypothetical protein
MHETVHESPRNKVWAEFLFSRVIVLMISRARHGDTEAYFEAVARSFAAGTPYGEDGFGYPALAFFFVALPWLLGARTLQLYVPFYRAQCFAVDAALFYLLSRRLSYPALLAYIIATAILGDLLYHRLDLLLGGLLVAALVLEERGSTRLGSITLGAAAAFKVIPLLLVPAWLGWRCRRSLAEALGAALFLGLGLALPMGLGCFLWGADALFFLREHGERGIQLESTWASLGFLLTELGHPGETYFAAGSHNLSTPFEGAFTKTSHLLGAAAGLWGGVLAARLSRAGAPLVLPAGATLGAAMAASKVFSPQFFLFFLPLLLWSRDKVRRSIRPLLLALAVACCALTAWVYPHHEAELVALSPVATLPLAARNALFLVIAGLLQVEAWRAGGGQAHLARAEETP